ncbi:MULTISPECIES: hypothetical protein [unclassified Janthinobacterium]|uniref:hypothetical protein n=1 Tax=unclassified Janthinobacterium TaxID=2610881 RepID=UPI00160AB89B|nr:MULTISPECIES: hypothetical protein [unclassified Janthinobacterium]MBB5606159.1 hypothetical protein [Janthinobacterium sp. S3T4]MBB5611969.1 hypothetical protein [Janthinobacterium sp. S3M3]
MRAVFLLLIDIGKKLMRNDLWLGVGVLASLISGCTQSSPEKSAEDIEKIAFDCGTTKPQMEAWFATHKTGWAEHVAEGLKCIEDHP